MCRTENSELREEVLRPENSAPQLRAFCLVPPKHHVAERLLVPGGHLVHLQDIPYTLGFLFRRRLIIYLLACFVFFKCLKFIFMFF